VTTEEDEVIAKLPKPRICRQCGGTTFDVDVVCDALYTAIVERGDDGKKKWQLTKHEFGYGEPQYSLRCAECGVTVKEVK
jgi:hypothetical protein